MTLATHIVIAAAIAKPLTGNPFIGFFIGVLSHYLSDAIPHWDYRLHSVRDKTPDTPPEALHTWSYDTILTDIRNTAIDFSLGFGVALLFFWPVTLRDFLYVLLVAIGGVLPDFLQGVYYTRKAGFLKPLQTFHDIMHTSIKLGHYPLIGIPFQALIFAASLWMIL